MANQRKKISELPALSVASLDTTFVLGISGSTTYKISINNLTSSLDTTFATDLVTNALSSSLNGKLSTSSFNSYTQSFTASVASGTISGSSQLTSSFDTRYVVSGSITQTTWDNIANKPSGIVSQSTDLSSLNTFTASVSTASLVTSISNLNTFTASQSTSSLVNRLNAIENVSGSWITESETGSFLTSLNGAISSSAQITAFGFVSGSYETTGRGIISSSTQIVSGLENATITNLTITNLHSVYQTSSVVYASGSNQFGDALTDSHIFSGSIIIVGSGSINGYNILTSNDTGSFETTGRGILSGSISYNNLTDIPQNIASGSYETTGRGILSGSISYNNLTNTPSGIISSSSQLPSGVISGSSQLTSSYDTRYVISGSITQTTWDNIGSKPSGIVSGSSQILGGSGIYSSSAQLPVGIVSGSSQLTTSFDGRYTQTGSFNSFTSSINNWSSSISTFGTLNTDYIQVQKSADQTGVAKNTDITFNVVTATNSGITHSNGVFTLTAGKTYVLEASLCINTFSDAAAYLWWSWVDSTTNTQLDTSNGGVLATGASGVAIPTTWTTNDNYVGYAKLIYTPATNQTIKVRATDGSGTCKVLAIASKATITQINPSVALNQFSTLQVSGSLSVTGSFNALGGITGSIRATNGVISGSSQLTSSFDTRYAISASFVSSSNLSSIRTITSASYAALTPVSGTLYIIIG